MQLLPDAGMPFLIPPPPETATAAEPAQCAAVSRQALQDLSDAITAARQQADANVAANGEGVPGAGYPVAATHGRNFLVNAQEDITQLLAQIDQYPPSLIHVPGITYAIYNSCRGVIVAMHYARHWETISAVYNREGETTAVAVECVDLTTAAIELAETMATAATGCYMHAYTG